jgi:hypothetical protein
MTLADALLILVVLWLVYVNARMEERVARMEEAFEEADDDEFEEGLRVQSAARVNH